MNTLINATMVAVMLLSLCCVAGGPPLPAPSPPIAVGSAQPSSMHLYVSADGIDTNPGSPEQPFRTIGKAANAAFAGTTVHVAPGTYRETVLTKPSGTKSARIRYVSTERFAARIVGGGKEAAWTNHGDHVDIAGFDITGSGRIGILNLGSHTSIENNHVHHIAVAAGCTPDGGAGIDNANYTGSDGDIVSNIVHDIGTPGACNGVHGIYSSNARGRIMNNVVYRSSSFGIHLWHAADRVTVANNTVFANGSANMGGGIVLGNGDVPPGTVLDHTHVINNIVVDNPGASIKEFCYKEHDCTGANNLISHNLVFNNGAPITLRRGRAIHVIKTDPRFVRYRPDGSGDYRLSTGSPAIAAGLRRRGTSAESAGVRPIGPGAVNIGASIDLWPVSPAPPATR